MILVIIGILCVISSCVAWRIICRQKGHSTTADRELEDQTLAYDYTSIGQDDHTTRLFVEELPNASASVQDTRIVDTQIHGEANHNSQRVKPEILTNGDPPKDEVLNSVLDGNSAPDFDASHGSGEKALEPDASQTEIASESICTESKGAASNDLNPSIPEVTLTPQNVKEILPPELEEYRYTTSPQAHEGQGYGTSHLQQLMQKKSSGRKSLLSRSKSLDGERTKANNGFFSFLKRSPSKKAATSTGTLNISASSTSGYGNTSRGTWRRT